MRPCVESHPSHHPECRLCQLAMTHEDYARMWGEPWPPVTTVIAAHRPIAPTTACDHLGEVLSKCPLDDPMRDIRACAKHQKTTLGFCAKCPDHTARQKPQPILTNPKTDEEHRLAADHVFHNPPPYPDARFSGKGIVIAAGGSYWPSAYVTVRMLRHVGCKLPIQVWYLGGRGERDKRYESALYPYGVTCVDADDHPARSKRRILNGFEIKLFAVMNSTFEEVLFLDADNYPCEDPTILFEQPDYLRVGGIYWPDLAETNAWTRWNFWGVQPFPPSCGWETGQYVVNKRLAWQQLTLAEWYDDHSDWCYGAGAKGDHGDKGPHRVAWAKARIAPVFFSTQAVWQRIAFLQPGPSGRTMFVHRCRSKFTVGKSKFTTTPQNGQNARAGLPLEKVAFEMLDQLRKNLT